MDIHTYMLLICATRNHHRVLWGGDFISSNHNIVVIELSTVSSGMFIRYEVFHYHLQQTKREEVIYVKDGERLRVFTVG